MFGRKSENSLCVHLLLVQVIYFCVKFSLLLLMHCGEGAFSLVDAGFGLHCPMLLTILGPVSTTGRKQEFQAT